MAHEKTFKVPPNKLETEIAALVDDIQLIAGQWACFRSLFDVIRSGALKLSPHALSLICETLVDGVVLGLCRITEKTSVCGKETLVIDRFHHPTSASAELRQAINNFKEAAKQCVRLRNDVLAHRNRSVAIGAEPFPKLHRREIESAVDAARIVVQLLPIERIAIWMEADAWVQNVATQTERICNALLFAQSHPDFSRGTKISDSAGTGKK